MTQKLITTIAVAAAGTLIADVSNAQATPPLYEGKTINLVIGSGEGGAYDLGARIMARYLKEFIPGKPTIVPRNMPGASSVVAAEYVFNVAAPDGLTISTVQPTIVLTKSLQPSVKYEPARFSWIGRVRPVELVGVGWVSSGASDINKARQAPMIVSASGASGTSAIVPWALNQLAGTKFKVVRGYKSQQPQFLAMERGEVQGIGSAMLADVISRKEWMDQGKVSILYTISQKRSKIAPQAPTIVELAKSDEDRKVLMLLGSISEIGQHLMAPPGVPEKQLNVLRSAFDKMTGDKDFISDMSKIQVVVDPLPGKELAELVSSTMEARQEVVERLRAVTQPQ